MSRETNIWIIDEEASVACLERLGDARRLADAMNAAVGVLIVSTGNEFDPVQAAKYLIRFGADIVVLVQSAIARSSTDAKSKLGTRLSASAKANIAKRILTDHPVNTVFASGDPPGREWASTLAAGNDWDLVSPAMMIEFRRGCRVATRLDPTGRKSCQHNLGVDQRVVVTMRPGVAEACLPDDLRTGEVRFVEWDFERSFVESQITPADPNTCDIRDAKRLVSGGRGLGSAAGFELLGKVAQSLGAGVAASRMAVDLGWIEYDRQVGKTGKTVQPELYIACGISGASHHLEGMSESKHVVAINTDASAPIMKKAHLALVADLHPVLIEVHRQLQQRSSRT